jgi:hypothetical protein
MQGGSGGMAPPPQQGMGKGGPAMGMGNMANMAGMAMGPRPGIAIVDPTSLPSEARDTIYIDVLPPDISRRELAHIFRPFEGYKVSAAGGSRGSGGQMDPHDHAHHLLPALDHPHRTGTHPLHPQASPSPTRTPHLLFPLLCHRTCAW